MPEILPKAKLIIVHFFAPADGHLACKAQPINHTKVMDTVVDTLSTAPTTPNLERIVLAQVEQWLGQCHAFRQWYRQHFLKQSPTAEQQELADQIQPWMIRITRALLSQMLDPEFPYRHLARSVEATLWQLEEDWASRHNPMSEVEADQLIQTYFPDHAS